MARLTIVYTDGYEEHYRLKGRRPEDAMQMHHFKQMIENEMLKLILEEEQMVLIPMVNIRKVIFRAPEVVADIEPDFPGFLHVDVNGTEL